MLQPLRPRSRLNLVLAILCAGLSFVAIMHVAQLLT